MSLTVQPLPVPLSIDETGTVRVTGTRITLELVVARFEEGASPEEIVHSYDTLRLQDTYAVLAYYLASISILPDSPNNPAGFWRGISVLFAADV